VNVVVLPGPIFVILSFGSRNSEGWRRQAL
jgi:hypothetical protein